MTLRDNDSIAQLFWNVLKKIGGYAFYKEYVYRIRHMSMEKMVSGLYFLWE